MVMFHCSDKRGFLPLDNRYVLMIRKESFLFSGIYLIFNILNVFSYYRDVVIISILQINE